MANILVTTGTQKFQFDRLVKAVDEYAKTSDNNVYIQYGHSTYIPKYAEASQFLQKDKMEELQAKSDIVITHGGTASIIEVINMGKKVIAVPRLSKYKEHVDDHQLEVTKALEDNGSIICLSDMSKLDEAIELVQKKTFKPYISNTKNALKILEEALGI